jgi:hypothetical protein
MISSDQIEEWLREVEERPSSAQTILRLISIRLQELTRHNEELLDENITLRGKQKVEEYENRIAGLEYQVELLKRQVGSAFPGGVAPAETLEFLVYHPDGRILRKSFPIDHLAHATEIARLKEPLPASGSPVQLLVANPHEELLLVFDSGRTVKLPLNQVPLAVSGHLDWESAYDAEPHGKEELAAILPIARMSLFDACVQTSRRGCIKRMMKSSFEANIAKNYIGSGVKTKLDKVACLSFANKGERIVLVTQEGYLVTLDVEQLPYTVEEALLLNATDHIVTAFSPANRPSILVITHNSKAIHRETGWLEPAGSFKSRGQPVFSQARREAGVKVIGAAAVDENDWCAVLSVGGAISVYTAARLLDAGSLPLGDPPDDLAGLAVFPAPQPGGAK